MAEIIVGVDGSEGARNALAWAIEEGALRPSPVRAVYAIGRDEVKWAERLKAGSETRASLQAAGEKELHDAVASLGPANVLTEVVLSTDMTAAEVLVEHSQDSALLVVGSRGFGGFSGLLLGSVSQQVLHHSRCPVVVVPPRRS